MIEVHESGAALDRSLVRAAQANVKDYVSVIQQGGRANQTAMDAASMLCDTRGKTARPV
jgi:hypothetical protein